MNLLAHRTHVDTELGANIRQAVQAGRPGTGRVYHDGRLDCFSLGQANPPDASIEM